MADEVEGGGESCPGLCDCHGDLIEACNEDGMEIKVEVVLLKIMVACRRPPAVPHVKIQEAQSMTSADRLHLVKVSATTTSHGINTKSQHLAHRSARLTITRSLWTWKRSD